MYDDFSRYERTISTYGTILLNEDGAKLVLCRTWEGKSWSLQDGKANQNKSRKDDAASETYEETRFDLYC